ncbi:MAG TPA: nucleotide pyrophosphatase/phosphodiesterase family protein [Vicinamibacterales bacterium]|nr:nucleotide pyrophosphatase/phosphodiesterase family protein [Vicinamibacterales bacterium]
MPSLVRLRGPLFFVLCAVALVLVASARAADPPPNVILFIPDGLRAGMVSMDTAPALASLAKEGVTFTNSHSVYPTLTMPNAAALATGHYPGDTGVFGNAFLLPFALRTAGLSRIPQIENDAVLGEIGEQMRGSFVAQPSLLARARLAGYSTAAIGKLGPTLLQDYQARDGRTTIIIDDATGTPNGVPLAPDVAAAIAAAGLPTATPGRGENARGGTFETPGTTTPNVAQQNWVVDVAARVLLPLFKARAKPFVLVYWSRDPDGSQHNQGDSFQRLEPGINGPTSLAGIRNADSNLRRLREALTTLDLAATTNIMVAADHGFSTVSRESATSPAARRRYADVVPGRLPSGFLSIDLAEALGLPLWDPNRQNQRVKPDEHTTGNGVIGNDPAAPEAIVAADGGVALIYLPGSGARALARRMVTALMSHDYVSGVFVDDALGSIAGTLPLSAIRFVGRAATPRPSMVVNTRSFTTGCAVETTCSALVSNAQQQGQGHHGGFGRAETFNFMAAVGPSFKARFVDPMPVGNVDVHHTMASILRLPPGPRGGLTGRVLEEALVNGHRARVTVKTLQSAPGPDGRRTVLRYQEVGGVRYFDAAGTPGRTVGLPSARP